MGFLGGGGGKQKSESKSESGNHAYDWAMDTFGDSAGANYNGSTNMLGNILGLNGSGASSQALDDYWNSSGGKFMLDQGVDAIDNKFSAMGLGRSGSAAKGMEQYRSDLASTKLDNYLGQLSNLAGLGLGAGGLVTNAGQWSKSSSSSSGSGGGGGGLGSIIGSVISTLPFILSDRRMKRDIERVGEWDDRGDGLGRYRFSYIFDENRTLYEGVMADEVERLRPAAFVPNFRGEYAGVNYARISK